MLFDLLNHPSVYLLSQQILGAKRARRLFIDEFVRPSPGIRILDIGCGPGYVIEYLPKTAYVGFDTERRYIEYAKKTYGRQGQFYCQHFDVAAAQTFESFDAVLMTGVMHHLSDEETLQLFSTLQKALKVGGRLFALEPCYTKNQSSVTKFILDHDRGKYIRAERAYVNLARSVFDSVTTEVRDDLFYIPYTLVMLNCRSG